MVNRIFKGNTNDFEEFARAGVVDGNYNERQLKYYNYVNGFTSRSLPAAIKASQKSKAAEVFQLFADGEQGAWYDPSDLSTLFQDSAGTTPVTADGDPVGYMADKSGNGNHATQSIAASRPVYRTDGTLHWLEFDGVDDFIGLAFTQAIGYSRVSGINIISLTDDSYIFSGNTTRSTLYKRIATATNALTMYNGTNGPESVAPNLLVASEEYLTGPDKLYFNQVLESTADAGDDTGTGLYIGGGSGGTSNSQILFYGVVQFADPTDTKRQNAEKYMAEKAGVTL